MPDTKELSGLVDHKCLELRADSSNIKERATLQSVCFRQKRSVYFNNAYSKIKTNLNPDKFQQSLCYYMHLFQVQNFSITGADYFCYNIFDKNELQTLILFPCEFKKNWLPSALT